MIPVTGGTSPVGPWIRDIAVVVAEACHDRSVRAPQTRNIQKPKHAICLSTCCYARQAGSRMERMLPSIPSWECRTSKARDSLTMCCWVRTDCHLPLLKRNAQRLTQRKGRDRPSHTLTAGGDDRPASCHLLHERLRDVDVGRSELSARKAQGFYTQDELQLMINRRTSRGDIAVVKVNQPIIDRYYHEEATRRVMETYGTEKARAALLARPLDAGPSRRSSGQSATRTAENRAGGSGSAGDHWFTRP